MKQIEHMEWDEPKYSLAVPELDRQHKELIVYYNNALDNRFREGAEGREYFDTIVEGFIDSVTKHFETEEQHLCGKRYPQYDEHKLEHVKLLEKIQLVKREIQNDRWEIDLSVLTTTLKDWFMSHFNSYDLGAKEYFKDESDIQLSEGGSYFAFQG